MLSEKEARQHPDRGGLSRCIGRDLIASLDRLSMPLRPDDRIIVCTDGLYGVLEDRDIENLCRGLSPTEACRRLIDEANARGTGDNVTAAFLLAHNGAPDADAPGWAARLRSLLRFGR
jgi:PPM family protein phosphatase